ncbi:MAG: PGPGW domain-containing protein [Thermodesulfobacteriota bacterium]
MDSIDSIKRIGLLIVGWLFIVLGIIGLFLPFLQGILFILIGLAILSSRSKSIKRFLKHLEEHYPHHHKRVDIWREKIRNWFGKD